MTASMTNPPVNPCAHSETTCAYASHVLPHDEVAAAEHHIASCTDCQRELESVRDVVNSFAAWPRDLLRPSTELQARLVQAIGSEKNGQAATQPPWTEPEWEQVAPGIECKLLATDEARNIVSMLVRLAPGARYPAHTHAGHEELHLL